MRRTGSIASIMLAVVLTTRSGTARSAQPHAPVDRVTHDIAIDLPVTFAASSIWLATQLMQESLALSTCRWCDRDADGTDTLNALDKGVRYALRWSDTEAANAVSNVLGYAVSPGAALGLATLSAGLDGRLDEAPTNALLILEATFIASTLTQIAKLTIGRERPFVHVLEGEKKRLTAKPADNNVSFFSAHSSFAFAIAVSSGTIASLRGYRLAPWIWASGLALSTTIGYLRIAADRHYVTDVLTGALIGSIAGVGIPFLFHRGETRTVEQTGWAPSDIRASGSSFVLSWTW